MAYKRFHRRSHHKDVHMIASSRMLMKPIVHILRVHILHRSTILDNNTLEIINVEKLKSWSWSWKALSHSIITDTQHPITSAHMLFLLFRFIYILLASSFFSLFFYLLVSSLFRHARQCFFTERFSILPVYFMQINVLIYLKPLCNFTPVHKNSFKIHR